MRLKAVAIAILCFSGCATFTPSFYLKDGLEKLKGKDIHQALAILGPAYSRRAPDGMLYAWSRAYTTEERSGLDNQVQTLQHECKIDLLANSSGIISSYDIRDDDGCDEYGSKLHDRLNSNFSLK
jgi:hypothetical protein